MRHRIGNAAATHLGGNPNPPMLDNKGRVTAAIKEFCKDALTSYFTNDYFKECTGVDYKITKDSVTIGIEPAYMYQQLLIISCNRKKGMSYMQTGIAFCPHGSGLRSKSRYYKTYKINGKFKKFIDKWHGQLFKKKKAVKK